MKNLIFYVVFTAHKFFNEAIHLQETSCKTLAELLQCLTLYGNRILHQQSLNLQSKSTDWFLYDRDLRHGRVIVNSKITLTSTQGTLKEASYQLKVDITRVEKVILSISKTCSTH